MSSSRFPCQGSEGSGGIGADKLTGISPSGVSVRCTIQLSVCDIGSNIRIGSERQNFKETREYACQSIFQSAI